MKGETTKPLIGLVLVVKNEASILPRLFESLDGLIDTWTIVDTGSTDRTRETIRLGLKHLPGKLLQHKWVNYGRNATQAFRAAKDSAEWLLKLDADFTVEAHPGLRAWLANEPDPNVDAWEVEIADHGVRWRQPWLLRGDIAWKVRGPVHEYVDTSTNYLRPLLGLTLHHQGDGSDRGVDKFERYIKLLEPGVRKKDPRAVFYTAESHRFLGNVVEAAEFYDQRASMNGWEEERWYAAYMGAFMRLDIEGLFDAWRQRPWRHEPLSAAAQIANELGLNSDDRLFRETFGQPVQAVSARLRRV